MKRSERKGERGVALLVALFALMLLSAVGMAMMYWADTETSINTNYRDKQVATFAALSGLEEARELLIPATTQLPALTGLPVSGSKNIIYITNGTGVQPWTAGSDYADTELCHDRTAVLPAPSPLPADFYSTPCTSLPGTGVVWYDEVKHHSHVAIPAAFRLDPPLNFKWVRIQLKANNSTPFPALGAGTADNGIQVCWDGMHQIPLPAGYKSDCTPSGGVTQVVVTSPGSNYSAAPTVTLAAPPAGGTQATATAHFNPSTGILTGVTVTKGGDGYTVAPTVTIGAPTGSPAVQATGVAHISPAGKPIESLTVTSKGSPVPGCYRAEAPPTVNFSPNPANATAIAVLSTTPSCIAGLNISASCDSAYFKNLAPPPPSSNPGAAIVHVNGGSSFVGTINTDSHSNAAGSVSISAPGAGYTSKPVAADVTLTSPNGGTPCTASAVTPTMGYTVDHLQLINPGGGYAAGSPPSVAFSAPLSGTNVPVATATLSSNPDSAAAVISVTLTNPGSGYNSVPSVTFTAGCGVDGTSSCGANTAEATALMNGNIDYFTVTNSGSGYTSPPAVTFELPFGATGSGLQAVAMIQNGTYYSPVYLVTALSQTPTGARSMVQMEVAPAVRALAMPGALTLAGPQPIFNSPSSMNTFVDGRDHPYGGSGTDPLPPGCSGTPTAPHPSIGVYDDPNNPTSPSSVETMLQEDTLVRPDHYPGQYASPDVQNVYGALGDQGTTPSGLNSIVTAVAGMPGAKIYPPLPTGSLALGTLSPYSPTIDVVYGDLTLQGSNKGYGILVVTGKLTFGGNFAWNGLVLVIGKGEIDFGGGGGGTINGSLLVAKTCCKADGSLLDALASPTFSWDGGGNNSVFYDHCWADSMLSMIPFSYLGASTTPLKVLSTKVLSY